MPPNPRLKPKTHELKCWPQYFLDLNSGNKNFEIRKDDRGFKVGDKLVIREYYPHEDSYSGTTAFRTIIYITDYKQRKGYVVLGLA